MGHLKKQSLARPRQLSAWSEMMPEAILFPVTGPTILNKTLGELPVNKCVSAADSCTVSSHFSD